MITLIGYIIGYFITLFLLSKYGKSKLGIDYDKEKTYVNYDDWDSNAQAFTVFCIVWPLVYVILIILGILKLLTWISNKFIEINNKKVLLILTLSLVLSSCVESLKPRYVDALTQFIVVDAYKLNGMQTMGVYQIEVVDANGLTYDQTSNEGSNLKFRIVDTLGKYKIGQPIHFNKNR